VNDSVQAAEDVADWLSFPAGSLLVNVLF